MAKSNINPHNLSPEELRRVIREGGMSDEELDKLWKTRKNKKSLEGLKKASIK